MPKLAVVPVLSVETGKLVVFGMSEVPGLFVNSGVFVVIVPELSVVTGVSAVPVVIVPGVSICTIQREPLSFCFYKV